MTSKSFDTSILIDIPNLRPAESLVFCVDDACIFEAKKAIRVVNKHLNANEVAGDIKLILLLCILVN